jgi:aryl-alcohol dehydrogenase-like predicted oxidoreductase
MAMGMLAGRYTDQTERPVLSRAAVRGGIYAERVSSAAVRAGNGFARLARDHGYNPAQLAICWVKDRPAVTAPLIGPKTLEQLTSLIPVGAMTFPEALIAEVDRICPPGSAVANFHNSADWMQQHLKFEDS